MTQISRQFIEDAGLVNLSKGEEAAMYEQLVLFAQQRVLHAISDVLSEGQIEDMTKQNEVDEQWLIDNVPNYKAIVEQELTRLQNDVRSQREQLKK